MVLRRHASRPHPVAVHHYCGSFQVHPGPQMVPVPKWLAVERTPTPPCPGTPAAAQAPLAAQTRWHVTSHCGRASAASPPVRLTCASASASLRCSSAISAARPLRATCSRPSSACVELSAVLASFRAPLSPDSSCRGATCLHACTMGRVGSNHVCVCWQGGRSESAR